MDSDGRIYVAPTPLRRYAVATPLLTLNSIPAMILALRRPGGEIGRHAILRG